MSQPFMRVEFRPESGDPFRANITLEDFKFLPTAGWDRQIVGSCFRPLMRSGERGLDALVYAYWNDRDNQGDIDPAELRIEVLVLNGDLARPLGVQVGTVVVTFVNGVVVATRKNVPIADGCGELLIMAGYDTYGDETVGTHTTLLARYFKGVDLNAMPASARGATLAHPQWIDKYPNVGQPGSPGAVLGRLNEAMTHRLGDHAVRGAVLQSADINLQQALRCRRLHYYTVSADGDLQPWRARDYPKARIDWYGGFKTPHAFGRESLPLQPKTWMYDPLATGPLVSLGACTAQDPQHAFRPLRYIAHWMLSGSRAARFISACHVQALLSDPVGKDPDYVDLAVNQRHQAWPLKLMAAWYSACSREGDAVAAADALNCADVIVTRTERLKGELNGVPWLTLNHNAGPDHFDADISSWQNSLLVDSLGETLEAMPVDGYLNARLLALYEHGARTLDYTATRGLGLYWSDVDPYLGNFAGPGSGFAGTFPWIYVAASRVITLLGDPDGTRLPHLAEACKQSPFLQPGNKLYAPGIAADVSKHVGWRT